MNKTAMLASVLCLATGLILGYVLFGTPDSATDAPQAKSREPLFYRNPMNPAITSPIPARDSMGMDYIPVYADEGDRAAPGTVQIDPAVQSNIGLKTAVAEKKRMGRTIRAVGRVDYDEEKLVRLHPKVEGWIREMRVDKTGETVSYDDILLTIYSPKLVATQQEYLLALNNFRALEESPFEDVRRGARQLVGSSRERLELLDVPEHQIVELEQTGEIKQGLHIHAPAAGTVLKVGARPGQYVNPGTAIYQIADLSTVWVYADIYEYELPWVKLGDCVEMTLAGVPGKIFYGEVSHIYPYAEAKTRTTRVRIVFDNKEGLLRPESFAELLIRADEKPGMIVIPSEAVVRSGDFDQVYIVNDSGRFEPRKVVLGIESRGEVAVESGVREGERVVVSAQFLVDSESRLREATSKMMRPDSSESDASDEGMHHD